MDNFHYTAMHSISRILVPPMNKPYFYFHDMLHDCPEGYIDNIVIKSKQVFNHVNDLRKVLVRCRQYKLRMYLLRYAFGISSEKFLGSAV